MHSLYFALCDIRWQPCGRPPVNDLRLRNLRPDRLADTWNAGGANRERCFLVAPAGQDPRCLSPRGGASHHLPAGAPAPHAAWS